MTTGQAKNPDLLEALADLRAFVSDELEHRKASMDPAYIGHAERALASVKIVGAAVNAGQEGPKGDVSDIPDSDLVERAVKNAHSGREPGYARWRYVHYAFGLGSTYAIQLCARFGLNPEEFSPAPEATALSASDGDGAAAAVPENRRTVEVHNAYALHCAASDPEGERICQFSRPQDWGHPKWTYTFIKFEWHTDDAVYINNAHCWIDAPVTEKGKLPQIFGPVVCMIMMPGWAPELCGRTHLAEEDFWEPAWGPQPPVWEGTSDAISW